MSTPATTAAFWCADDEQIVTDPIPVYECSRCSTRTDERRCSDCNIFTARDGDGCPDCFAELEETEVVTDHDGETIRAEEYEPDGPSLAERTAAEAARSVAAYRDRKNKKRSALEDASTETTWSQVAVGDSIVVIGYDGEPDDLTQPQVHEILTAGPRATALPAGTLIAGIAQYGARIVANAPDAPVRVMNKTPSPVPSGDRFTCAEADSPLWGTGAQRLDVEIGTGKGDKVTSGDVPMAQISTSRPHSNQSHGVALFWHPSDALAFARAAREAAQHLPIDGEPLTPAVVTARRHLIGNLTVRGTFITGADGDTPFVEFRGDSKFEGGQRTFSTAFASRVVLDAIADAADQCAAILSAALDVQETR